MKNTLTIRNKSYTGFLSNCGIGAHIIVLLVKTIMLIAQVSSHKSVK